jgi:Ca-activated chloride channel family protein
MFIYTGYNPTYDSNIPLQSVAVVSNMVDTFGTVTLSQKYKNNYTKDIEAIYCFNLDTSSVPTGMVLQLGSKRLVSEVKEKTSARTTYNQAKSEHKTTCLLEKNGDGSYKVNLGNIQPAEEITVELTYVTTLSYTNGETKFVLPTNISEKYGGSSNKTVKDILNSVSSVLSYSSKASYAFSFNLNYKSHNTITGVKSQTNEVVVTQVSQNEVNVTSTSMPSNGDFNLLIETVIAPGLYYHTQGDTTYLAVTHKIPEQSLDLLTVQKEFIFIVDRSGSMDDKMVRWSGSSSSSSSNSSKTKIENAKDALTLFINSLPPKSKFNVYSFGNSFTSMFPNSVDLTDETKTTALNQIKKFEADMGGTEIFGCLQSIFTGEGNVKSTQPPIDLSKRTWKPDPASEYEKVVAETTSSLPVEKVLILLTDGQVGNADAVVTLCETYNYLSRVFCIGIGADVDRNLVHRVATASSGSSDILVDNDDVSSSVVKMLDSSLKTYYKFVGVNVGGKRSVEHTLYPNQSLSFFKAVPTSEFMLLTELQLSGVNGLTGDTESWALPVTSKAEAPSYLKQLWANDQIKSYLADNNRNKFTNEIIKLSVENSLASDYTSFVVVDEVVHANQSEETVTINVPQFGGGQELCRKESYRSGASMMACSAAPRAKGMTRGGGGSVRLARSFGASIGSVSNNDSDECDEEECDGLESCAAELQQQAGVFKKTSKSNSKSKGSSGFLSGVSNMVGSVFGASSSSSSNVDCFGAASAASKSVRRDEREEDTDFFASKSFDNTAFNKSWETSKTTNNVDYLLNFKNVDGSFTYDEKVLKTIGVSVTKFDTVVSSQGVSPKYLVNVLVLAYLKLVNNSKYTMIQKMLEAWLTSNKSVEVPESVTTELFTA